VGLACLALIGAWACAGDASGRGGGIVIVEPSEGAHYQPGEPVAVVVDLAPGSTHAKIERVVISLGDHQEAIRGTAPWRTEVKPQAELVGDVSVSAAAILAGDPSQSWFADDVTLHIDPSALALTTLKVSPRLMVCSSDTTSFALTVTGVFDDGVTRELTRGVGTAYVSADPDVASVGPGGVVECHAVGQTTIRATYRNIAATSRVVVEEIP
jgi:hypothetical protein